MGRHKKYSAAVKKTKKHLYEMSDFHNIQEISRIYRIPLS